MLVNSHLHIDHVGGNQLFKDTGVRNLIHERELAQARNHEPFEFFGYSDKSWDYEGANIETVSGDVELAPGLWLLRDARPHGRPLLLSLLRGRRGRCCSRWTSRTRRPRSRRASSPASTTTPVDGVRSIARVKALAAEHGADVFFSHDMEAWQTYKHAPGLLRALGGRPMGKLDNRVAIVTGAAQGIGKAVADKLAEEGATVVGADIQAGTTMQADVSKEEDVKRMVDETVGEYGKLDVLVNVAAIVPFTPWDEIDFAEWRRIMSVNLDGTFLTNHHAQKAMGENGYGRIVNIASNVVLAGTPNLAHYVASKGGVLGVHARARARARQVRHHGQRGRARA